MNFNKQPYEISVWKDVYTNGVLKEVKIGVIGSHIMINPGRALSPKITLDTKGISTLNFDMLYRYYDPIELKEKYNPFVDLLNNETRLKVNDNGKWYDFTIKNITKNSENQVYSYVAQDTNVLELSKNGFSIVLDNENMDNVGSAYELCKKVIADTDWTISESDCDVIVQTIEENLIKCKATDIEAYLITDPQGKKGIEIASTPTKISGDIYVFYSCTQDKPHIFQFLKSNNFTIENNTIINNNCQYYMELRDSNYLTDKLALPIGIELVTNLEETSAEILKGKRYVISQDSIYFAPLKKYVNKYYDYNLQKEVYGFSESEFVAPTYIQNCNPNNEYKDMVGWQGSMYNNNPSLTPDRNKYIADVNSFTYRISGNKCWEIIDDFYNGEYGSSIQQTYKGGLRVKFQSTSKSVLVNEGFYSNRYSLPKLVNGQRYVLKCNIKKITGTSSPYTLKDTNKINIKIATCEYDITNGGYNSAKQKIYAEFKNLPVSALNGTGYAIAEIRNADFTDESFKKSNVKIYITATEAGEYLISDFQIFRYVESKVKSGSPIFLEDLTKDYDSNDDISADLEGQTFINYIYFDPDINKNIKSREELRELYIGKSNTIVGEFIDRFKPVLRKNAEKIRSISAKESNRFNILQNISETFECWIDYQVSHDSNGKTLKKKLVVKRSIGQDNYCGIRRGVNLKSISETQSTDSFTSKLIVKQNANEYAENGFCTIARSEMNPTRDTHLYDFSYYVRQGMLDEKYLYNILYATFTDENGQKQGNYYGQLEALNKKITELQQEYNSNEMQRIKLDADYEFYNAGKIAAQEQYDTICTAFEEEIGYSPRSEDWTEEADRDGRLQEIQSSEVLSKYLIQLAEYAATDNLYTKKLQSLTKLLNNLNNKINNSKQGIEFYSNKKKQLNKWFYTTMHRYIQEGTWNSEEYMDDNKYYLDALGVLFNSSIPKVEYNINIMEISGLPGLENFSFELGDRTFIEDVEYFGWNNDGSPFRKESVLTQLVKHLDSPKDNTAKIQTHQTEFADLFQKITATTQQLQFSEGVYNKAANLVSQEEYYKKDFVESAINEQITSLTLAGDQSVVWDKSRGLVITNLTDNKQIRIAGAGISLRKMTGEGKEKWSTAITADGIVADSITTGNLNTNLITIMNGNEATFRWNSYGLNALYRDPITQRINQKKAVRFDQYGIYGFDFTDNKEGLNASNWKPKSEQELTATVIDNKINNHLPTFSLLWDGLRVQTKGNNSTSIFIGTGKNNLLEIKNDKGQSVLITEKTGETTISNCYIKNLTVDGLIFLSSDKRYYISNSISDEQKYYINLPQFKVNQMSAIFEGGLYVGDGGYQVTPDGTEIYSLSQFNIGMTPGTFELSGVGYQGLSDSEGNKTYFPFTTKITQNGLLNTGPVSVSGSNILLSLTTSLDINGPDRMCSTSWSGISITEGNNWMRLKLDYLEFHGLGTKKLRLTPEGIRFNNVNYKFTPSGDNLILTKA